jgi:Flp pilus assembly protein protease CpaA
MIPQIQFAANVIAGTLSAYTDLDKGYIYNWITHPLIIIGILLSIYTQNWLGFLLAGGIYGIGVLAYRTGQMGGGDIYLLAGLSLVQPTFQGMIFPLAVLLIGALSACMVFGVYYVGKFLLSKPRINWHTPRKKGAGILLVIFVALFIYMNAQLSEGGITLILLEIAMVLGLVFYAFEDEIKKHHFLKKIEIGQLEDDEVLAIEHLTTKESATIREISNQLAEKEWDHYSKLRSANDFRKKIDAYVYFAFNRIFNAGKKEAPSSNLISREYIEGLRGNGITHVPVYRNLPKFAPFLLIGILATYFFPEYVSQLVPSFL